MVIWLLTFISEGKRSRWMKYERRLVWYAPDTTDKAASIALRRMSTISISACPIYLTPGFLQFLPVRIVTSKAATKSVKTASMRSNPAKTAIISELGFGYFFGRIQARNTVAVLLCQPCHDQRMSSLTSRACASAGALPAWIHATALANSCRVCTYDGVKIGSLATLLIAPSYLKM